LKSKSIPWTRIFFNKECPCGSQKKSYECCWKGNGCWEKLPVGIITGNTGSFAHEKCYASPLKGCGQKITREHFLSRNILEKVVPTSTVRFENAGHFFGGKNQVDISIDDFSSKVLCDSHNSALSVLDTAAKNAFSTIEKIGHAALRKNAPESPERSFHLSSGIDMERWMIKVYCGLVAAKKIRGQAGTLVQRSDLEPRMLPALFGTNPLPSPLGLYVQTFVGQNLTPGNLSFSTIKLTDGSDDVGGLILTLGVMDLVLITSPKYGHAFKNPNWYRRQTVVFGVREGSARLGYLFTY